MNNIPEHIWQNCVRHVRKLEDKYRGCKSMSANSISRIVIKTGDSDTSSEESSEEEDE